MASTQQLRRLQRVEVDGLFGLYDHRIDLELNDRVTFLHGPNGVGKTAILKMIDAALTERFGSFSEVRDSDDVLHGTWYSTSTKTPRLVNCA